MGTGQSDDHSGSQRHSQDQLSGPAGAKQGDPGLAFIQSVLQRRQELLGQCPVEPAIDPQEAATFPVCVAKWGEKGPRIILIHGGVQGGLGGGPVTWDRQQALADRGWRIERVERPGFGESPSRGPDDMEGDAEWIADMVGDGAVLFGHSWGGAETLLAAARRGDAVQALILVEPALHALLAGHPEGADASVIKEARFLPTMILQAKTPAELGRGFAGAMGSVGESSNNAAASALSSDAAAASLGCALLRGKMAPPQALGEALAAVSRARIPTLTISGGWSSAFDAIAKMVARVTGGEHAIVESPNHFVQQASADAFNDRVDNFLRRVLT